MSTHRLPLALVLAAVLVPAIPCLAAKAPAAPKPKPVACKEPAVKDPDLAAGLALYLEGKWVEAGDRLEAWTKKPGVDKDPAAARGYYCLAYATRQRGSVDGAARWYVKAEPLLKARLAEAPSLELQYYLQALYQAQGNTQAQLAVVSEALQQLEAGRLCPKPDGDDLFRESRLAAAAGRKEQERELLAKADAAYAKGQGSVTAYRAFTQKGLGDAAREAADWPAAQRRYEAAAALDPLIPGVHWGVGLARLHQSDFRGAADWWREHWKEERQNGNALNYVIPVLDRLVRYREKLGDRQVIGNLAEYTVPALEQNIQTEAGRVVDLEGQRAKAKETGGDLSAEDAAALESADYRMLQFTAEYVLRERDLQEFALKNGLLGVLLRRNLRQ